MGGLAEGYKALSRVPDPGLEDLVPLLVVLAILYCRTCWLGGFGALGLRGAIDEGIVVGRWHNRLLSRSAWHPGPCWGRGSGWRGRDGEATQGVRGLHALQTGRCSIGAGTEERQRGWAPLSCSSHHHSGGYWPATRTQSTDSGFKPCSRKTSNGASLVSSASVSGPCGKLSDKDSQRDHTRLNRSVSSNQGGGLAASRPRLEEPTAHAQ